MSYHSNLKDPVRAYLRRNGIWPLARTIRSIRLQSMVIGGEPRDVTIRLVETRKKFDAARELVNDRYAWRGYGDNHEIPADPHHVTFTAEIGEEVVGTITLAVDSSVGLAIDKAFFAEVAAFRCIPGAKVCELTKFAFCPNIQSKELMAALFHIVFVYGSRARGGTDLFIEVNPRHMRFYESMLGFKRVGCLKQNESVAAPAQLMWLEVSEIRDQILKWGGGQPKGGRSLYPFFFSPTVEDGIYRRLAAAQPELIELHSDEEELAILAKAKCVATAAAQSPLAAATSLDRSPSNTPHLSVLAS